MIKIICRLLTCSFLLLVLVPPLMAARSNLLRGGVSVGLDLSERDYEDVVDNPNTAQDESVRSAREDEYRRLVISPLVVVTSSTPRDSFERSKNMTWWIAVPI